LKTTRTTAQLEDLVEDGSPITYGVVKPGEEGDIVFIRGGDLANGRILDSRLRTITNEVSEQYRRTLLRGGELLISLVGNPGQVAVVPQALIGANIARQVGLIRLRSEMSAEFVRYFLESPEGRASLGTQTGGSVQQVINLRDLRTVTVPRPPLTEQHRVVGILDEAFDGIATAKANAEKSLQNARALFESHLESVFSQRGEGWLERYLRDVADTQYGLSEPMNEEGKGFKIFRMGELQDGRLSDTGQMKYADIASAEFEKYKLRPGDVLFNRTNSVELVGKTGIFTLRGDYCFASYLVRVLVDRKVLLSEFLNYFMNHCCPN